MAKDAFSELDALVALEEARSESIEKLETEESLAFGGV